MIESFLPIISQQCRILILGTMPGVMSLHKQEYYGHERNQFWRLLQAVFNQEIKGNYQEKKVFLLGHGIALWDVLKSCDREGSLDSKILNPVANDFNNLFTEYPNIKAVCFNGTKAEEFFRRFVKPGLSRQDFTFLRLPSSSPTHILPFEEKLQAWRQIRLLMEPE